MPTITPVALGAALIKGTRHRRLTDLAVDADGPRGDREFCLIDAARARVLRTVQHPALLAVDAQWASTNSLRLEVPRLGVVEGPLAATGANLEVDYWGRRVRCEVLESPHAAALSAYLRRPVLLARGPRGEIVYGAPVSLVSTASLRDVAERTGRPGLLDPADWGRWRLTMVVDAGEEPYVEDTWRGREIVVGEGQNSVRLAIGEPIGRCPVIDHDPRTGTRDRDLLRALQRYRPSVRRGEPWLGVDASVVAEGTLSRLVASPRVHREAIRQPDPPPARRDPPHG